MAGAIQPPSSRKSLTPKASDSHDQTQEQRIPLPEALDEMMEPGSDSQETVVKKETVMSAEGETERTELETSTLVTAKSKFMYKNWKFL